MKLENNCSIDPTARISEFTNLYGCEIKEDVFVGPFVEIQNNVTIGARSRVSSHSFICSGVNVGEDCFIAHGVMFTNDKFTEGREEWVERGTQIGNRVRIGSNATILPVIIGDDVIIGAGSVIIKDVISNTKLVGNPGRLI